MTSPPPTMQGKSWLQDGHPCSCVRYWMRPWRQTWRTLNAAAAAAAAAVSVRMMVVIDYNGGGSFLPPHCWAWSLDYHYCHCLIRGLHWLKNTRHAKVNLGVKVSTPRSRKSNLLAVLLVEKETRQKPGKKLAHTHIKLCLPVK